MKPLIAMLLAGAALGGGAYWYVSSGPGPAGPVLRVDVTDLGNGNVTVSWTRVGSSPGGAITGYEVTAKPAGNDRVPPPPLVTPPTQMVPAAISRLTISGLLEDCHQLYQVVITPKTNAGSDPSATSQVFRPSGIVVQHKRPPFVVVLLDGIGSQAAGFNMDPYHPTAIGPVSYCPQNVVSGVPVPITVGTGANEVPNNAFLPAPYGPKESFLKWNAWDPADDHGGNVPETESNSTPRDLNPESRTFGKPTFSWMLDRIAATGAMILPYSYWGATLQGHGSADPTFVFNAYTDCNSMPTGLAGGFACTKDNSLDPGGDPDPAYHDYSNAVHSFSLSEDEDRLKTEVDSIENVWANEPIVIVGHSQGGLIAFETWRQHMLPGAVHHLFSLDSPINGVCGGRNLGVGVLQCLGPPGYPAYDLRYDRAPDYLTQDGGSDPAFRFIGTLGDEVRVRGGPQGSPASTPSYGTGTNTLQVQLLVTGANCTGTDHADCPSRVDHVSECQLPEQPWVLNRVTPAVSDQNRWIYDTAHFVVKFCPGNVNYFNTVLNLSPNQAGPQPVAAPPQALAVTACPLSANPNFLNPPPIPSSATLPAGLALPAGATIYATTVAAHQGPYFTIAPTGLHCAATATQDGGVSVALTDPRSPSSGVTSTFSLGGTSSNESIACPYLPAVQARLSGTTPNPCGPAPSGDSVTQLPTGSRTLLAAGIRVPKQVADPVLSLEAGRSTATVAMVDAQLNNQPGLFPVMSQAVTCTLVDASSCAATLDFFFANSFVGQRLSASQRSSALAHLDRLVSGG